MTICSWFFQKKYQGFPWTKEPDATVFSTLQNWKSAAKAVNIWSLKSRAGPHPLPTFNLLQLERVACHNLKKFLVIT